MKKITLEQAHASLKILQAMSTVAGKEFSAASAQGSALALAQVSIVAGLSRKAAHKMLDDVWGVASKALKVPTVDV